MISRPSAPNSSPGVCRPTLAALALALALGAPTMAWAEPSPPAPEASAPAPAATPTPPPGPRFRVDLELGGGVSAEDETGSRGMAEVGLGASVHLALGFKIAAGFEERTYRQVWISQHPDPATSRLQRIEGQEAFTTAWLGLDANPLRTVTDRARASLQVGGTWFGLSNRAMPAQQGGILLGAGLSASPAGPLWFGGGLSWSPAFGGTADTLSVLGLPRHRLGAWGEVAVEVAGRPSWRVGLRWRATTLLFDRTERTHHAALLTVGVAI